MRSRFTTNLSRTLLAILAGFLVCAAVFAGVVVLLAALDGRFLSIDWGWVARQLSGSTLLIVGAVGAVICLIGVPLWLPFHFSGRRHWVFAVSLGALLFFVAWLGPHTSWFSMPLAGDGFDDYDWGDALGASLGVAVVGAVIAGVMWRVAYRKVELAA